MKRLIVPAAVFCLVICGIQSVWAEDDAAPLSPRIEDTFVAEPPGDTAAKPPGIKESEATGRMDVLVLKNGNRFEGLILGETATQITLARYSGRVASPHTLRVSKSDVAGIERVRPERRASLEGEVRRLLDNTHLARRQGEIARRQEAETARRQRLVEAAREQQKAVEAARRQTPSMRTQNSAALSRSQTSRTAAARTALSRRQVRTARRVASVSTPGVRAAGKG